MIKLTWKLSGSQKLTLQVFTRTSFRFLKKLPGNILKWTRSLLVCSTYSKIIFVMFLSCHSNNLSNCTSDAQYKATSFILPFFRKHMQLTVFQKLVLARLLPVKFIFAHQFIRQCVRIWSKLHRFKYYINPETFTVTLTFEYSVLRSLIWMIGTDLLSAGFEGAASGLRHGYVVQSSRP